MFHALLEKNSRILTQISGDLPPTNAIDSYDVRILSSSQDLTLHQNNKILALTKLKVFAEDKFDVAKMMISVSDRERKHCGKRRKCWLTSIFSFSHNVSKSPLL